MLALLGCEIVAILTYLNVLTLHLVCFCIGYLHVQFILYRKVSMATRCSSLATIQLEIKQSIVHVALTCRTNFAHVSQAVSSPSQLILIEIRQFLFTFSHVTEELSWKSNVSYLATCERIVSGDLHGISSEYNNCKSPGLHLFNVTTRFSMSTSP